MNEYRPDDSGQWRTTGRTDALCPACTGSTGTVCAKERLDGGGLSVTVECDRCGERWTVVFWRPNRVAVGRGT